MKKNPADPLQFNPRELNYIGFKNVFLVLYYGDKGFKFCSTAKDLIEILKDGHDGKIVVVRFKRQQDDKYIAQVVFDSLFDFVDDSFKETFRLLKKSQTDPQEKYLDYFLRRTPIDYERVH